MEQFGKGQGSIIAASLFDNTGGSLLGNGNFMFTAGDLINRDCAIQAGGEQTDLTISLIGALDNSFSGTIGANGNLAIKALAIDNTRGTVGSVEGAVTLHAASGSLTNTSGRIEAADLLTLSSHGLTNTGGVLLGTGLNVNSHEKKLDNTRGAIFAG